MRQDPRIKVPHPWEAKHLTERSRREAELRALHSDVEWSSLITPLVAAVRQLASGENLLVEPLPPTHLAPEFVEPWSAVMRALREEGTCENLGGALKILVERLCQELAAEAPGTHLTAWLRVARVLSRLSAEHLFLDQLDPDLLRAHVQELLVIPAHTSLFDLVAPFHRLRDPQSQQGYLQQLSAQERSAVDHWDGLKRLDRDAGTHIFGAPLWQQASLLERLGGLDWLRFLYALPHTLLRQIAIRELESPDEALELVGLALDEAAAGRPTADERLHEAILVLLVRRTFELWNYIHGSLTELASGRFREPSEPPELLEQARASAMDWRERELPERARALAERLLQGKDRGAGFRTAAMALRHLFVLNTGWHGSKPEQETAPLVRDAFAQTLAKSERKLEDGVGAILGERSIRGALLSAALVVLEEGGSFTEEERSEQAGRIWAAYGKMLEAEKFIMNGPLAPDEEQLALGLGGMLARLPEPAATLEATLAVIWHPAEGWKASQEQFLESIRRVLHLVIVGAMAASWLKQRNRPAQPMFRLIWEKLHSLLRAPFLSIARDEVRSALAHVWARMWFIEGPASTERALVELRRLDHLDWLLLAASMHQRNMALLGGPPHVAVELQEVIWSRFERMFPLVRLHRAVTQEQLAQYEQDALKLTPDVQRAAIDLSLPQERR